MLAHVRDLATRLDREVPEAGVADPSLKSILAATSGATYVQLWLDTAFGSTVGNLLMLQPLWLAEVFGGVYSAGEVFDDLVIVLSDDVIVPGST